MNTSAHAPGPSRPARAALVTGAGRRLGREIALGLARAGWDVAVHYGSSRDDALQTVRDIESAGRRAVALQADLSDEAATASLIGRAAEALGPLRCLVNNASHFEPDLPATFDYCIAAAARGAQPGGAAAADALPARIPARRRSRCRGQPARPEARQPEPGLLQLHAGQGGTAHRHAPDGGQLRAEAARGRGLARHHADLGGPDTRRLRGPRTA